jgi:DNA-binding transcriptional MerR regulator/uncharacterized glyoxalase superfamily protein PhnB
MSAHEQRVWRIGELTAATGLTIRTLHHYDRIALLVPSRRSAGGHRLYTADDVRRLFRIVILRHAGLSLIEIRDLLERDAVDVPQLIDRQAKNLEATLIDTVALGRRLRSRPIAELIKEPSQVRELVNWAPTKKITSQPIVLLVYADVERAHRRLVEMFGFGAGEVSRNADGTVGYAEVTGPTGNIRLHGIRPGLRPPDPTAEPSSMTVVGVADVTAHYNQARAAGAEINRPLRTMFGLREYLAYDHEHHLWCFQQQVE